MSDEKLRAEFEERIRDRVLAKLEASDPSGAGPFDPSRCDQVMEVIRLIATENDLDRASVRLAATNAAIRGTTMPIEEAAERVSQVFSHFGPETALFYELQQLCEVEDAAPARLMGHLYLRLTDENPTPPEMPLKLTPISWTFLE